MRKTVFPFILLELCVVENVEYLTRWSFVIATRHPLVWCTSGSKCAVVLLPLGVLWPASNNNTIKHLDKSILAAKEMP